MISLAQASTIVDAALRKGRELNCAPLTVAVLDSGGHLVAFKREDKSGLLRFDIAFGKAWGALGMGFGSRTLAARRATCLGPQAFPATRRNAMKRVRSPASKPRACAPIRVAVISNQSRCRVGKGAPLRPYRVGKIDCAPCPRGPSGRFCPPYKLC
jgi:hypothetical protein